MRKKGFTLIELLVVIAIIAMLLAILMPALGKVKKLAERLVCATNLRGIVTSCVIYSNDADGNYPKQGGPGMIHTLDFTTSGWDNVPMKDWTDPGTITVGASLYLLIRYADVGPKSFVCRSGDETPFSGDNALNLSLEELWDFGGGPVADGYGRPELYVSYAYQRPYPKPDGSYGFPGSTSDKTERALIADKNPYYEEELTFAAISALDQESWIDAVALIGWHEQNEDSVNGFFKWHVKVGNSVAHEREGQNVGYGDSHVLFDRRPDVGVQSDNIYTPMAGGGPFTEHHKRQGTAGWRKVTATNGISKNSRDSFLMNDGPSSF